MLRGTQAVPITVGLIVSGACSPECPPTLSDPFAPVAVRKQPEIGPVDVE